MTIEQILEILEKYKLRIPPTVFYELKADIVNFEEPTTKNDLGVENDLVGSIIEKISEKVTETREEFIFETIRPYCENVVQMKISKRDLEQALLKYYGKNDLGVDCISRQSVLDKIQRLINAEQNNIDENGDYMNYARERVNAYEAIQFFVENDCLCPSVTPQELRKGHWIVTGDYCPNCGARMVEPQESEG